MDLYFHKGHILTMEEPLYAEALLLRDGKIAAVGSEATVRPLAKPGTCTEVDLRGRCLLPAFLDAHGHLTGYAFSLGQCDLSSARSFGDIVQLLRKYIAENHLGPGDWLSAGGYDQNLLKEKRHPDRSVLDQASDQVHIVAGHISGHMGAANSAALAAGDVGRHTKDPDGGRYGRDGAGHPNGYMEENAFLSFQGQVPMPSMEEILQRLEQAQRVYASHGICTMQEGMVIPQVFDILDTAAKAGRLRQDVIGYVDFKTRELLENHPAYRQYQGHLRLHGYKIFLDGSPQGRTAWLTQPYLGEPISCGYPTMTDAQVLQAIDTAEQQGVQLLAHCNGDAAAEQFLCCYERWSQGGARKPNRPVMIHAQLLRPDQLPRLKALGMIPSFFIAHIYYWGDVYVQSLGMERARRISPAGTAADIGLPDTFHTDSPVVQPDLIQTVWCAVNRLTREGRLLGKEQRVPVLLALEAITRNAAYQYGEEKEKGSLKPGKRGDLVILDRDPLLVPKAELRNLQVLATYCAGEPLLSL